MEAIDTLNLLLKTSRDGEHGFRLAAEEATDPALRATFEARARDCAQGAEELVRLIKARGGEPNDTTSLPGDLHRGWVVARYLFSGRGDAAILAECERGEDLALRDYRMAVREALPPEVAQAVRAQLDGVQRNHDQIKALRDARSPGRSLRLARGEGAAESRRAGRSGPVGRALQWSFAQARLHPVPAALVLGAIGVALVVLMRPGGARARAALTALTGAIVRNRLLALQADVSRSARG
jgi:uncharacterized protein (TIGR02284 family)